MVCKRIIIILIYKSRQFSSYFSTQMKAQLNSQFFSYILYVSDECLHNCYCLRFSNYNIVRLSILLYTFLSSLRVLVDFYGSSTQHKSHSTEDTFERVIWMEETRCMQETHVSMNAERETFGPFSVAFYCTTCQCRPLFCPLLPKVDGGREKQGLQWYYSSTGNHMHLIGCSH